MWWNTYSYWIGRWSYHLRVKKEPGGKLKFCCDIFCQNKNTCSTHFSKKHQLAQYKFIVISQTKMKNELFGYGRQILYLRKKRKILDYKINIHTRYMKDNSTHILIFLHFHFSIQLQKTPKELNSRWFEQVVWQSAGIKKQWPIIITIVIEVQFEC